MLFHIGSNKGDTIAFNLVNLQFSAAAKGAGIAEAEFVANANDKSFVKGTGGAITVNFSTAASVNNIIGFMDQMIGYVDGQRADLGAIQNHFPVISSPHKTSSKPDILAVLNSFERMATFRWFFCA